MILYTGRVVSFDRHNGEKLWQTEPHDACCGSASVFLHRSITLIPILLCDVLRFVVSVIGHHFYTGTNIKPQAQSIHVATQQLSSRRGRILDNDGAIIAQDSQTYDLVVIIGERYGIGKKPEFVQDKRLTADLIAPIIGMNPDDMFNQLNQEDLYQVQFGNYSRRLSLATKEEIEACFDPKPMLRHVDLIMSRFGL